MNFKSDFPVVDVRSIKVKLRNNLLLSQGPPLHPKPQIHPSFLDIEEANYSAPHFVSDYTTQVKSANQISIIHSIATS